MKTLLKIILAVMVGALMVVFLRPSFENYIKDWDSLEEVLVKIAVGAASLLFFGYYILLLWKEHGFTSPRTSPRTPSGTPGTP